ncbi:MAG: hypothetical protein ACP5MW_06415 [Thermoplasmata archaeon]
MNTKEDVDKLKQARKLIEEVARNVDCNYCRSHLEIIMNMIDDATDITKFNLLYENDEEALERLRKLLTEESTLRILAVASKIVGFFRKLKYK